MGASRTDRLARLLGAREPSLVALRDAARALEERWDLASGRPPPRPARAADDDPRAFLRWLLRMALATAARELRRSAGDPALDRLGPLLEAGRPRPDPGLGQLAIDPASCLRRARAVDERSAPGRVVLVGDDDGVSIALALLGRSTHVLDLDERVLGWVSAAGRSLGARIDVTALDVLRASLPPPLRRSAVAAVTDPYRSVEDGLPFVLMARAALSPHPGARLFLADHPEWTAEPERFEAALRAAALQEVERLEDLHAYPLLPDAFADRRRAVVEVGVDRAWLDALIEATEASSHLRVLRRLDRPGSGAHRLVE
ncbi:MAG: bis-aminopropyl spermidine synthase family protein [Sandaracinaceae bacterium]